MCSEYQKLQWPKTSKCILISWLSVVEAFTQSWHGELGFGQLLCKYSLQIFWLWFCSSGGLGNWCRPLKWYRSMSLRYRCIYLCLYWMWLIFFTCSSVYSLKNGLFHVFPAYAADLINLLLGRSPQWVLVLFIIDFDTPFKTLFKFYKEN